MNYGNKFFQIYVTLVLLPFIIGYSVFIGVLCALCTLGEESGQVWRMNK